MKNETEEEKQARLEYQREWRRKKKESDPDYWKRNYDKHKSLYIKWSKDNSHLQKEKYGHYYNGSDSIKQSRKKSLQKQLANGQKAALNNARRAKQNNPLSNMYRKEIAEIYRNCPKGYHVDHIYPINGENFSGLHVPWNLQYLTASENIAKSNKLLP
jgi:hypothetical protein